VVIPTILAGLIGVAVLALGVAWLGLRRPAPRFSIPAESRSLGTVPIPTDLPEVVRRYGQAVFGDSVPVVESAVVVGRATIRRNGLALPARLKIYYDARGDYYHYIEVTWFGFPVMTVNERYLDGHTILDIPGEHVENDQKTDHAANQGFWSEALAWAPSIVFTDERIRWEAISDTSARLILPNADAEEMFTVSFDPETGLISEITTLRYQDSRSNTRLRWANRIVEWGEMNGIQAPVRAQTQWNDEPPWAEWHIQQIIYNTDVSRRFNQFGGAYQD
jgi:hypothetical protein